VLRRRPGPRSRHGWAPAFAGALLAASPASAAVQPGIYSGNQHELATGLELLPDGRFRYGLSYGALDERAEGRWEERTGRVLLTTAPAPKPPRFPVVSDTPVPDGRLYAALEDADALGGFSLTLLVRYEGDQAFQYVEAGEDGLVPVSAGRTVAELVPALPIYDAVAETHRPAPGGHRIVFRFEPNDLGVADFRAEPLAVEGDTLILRRHDRVIRYRR
jgi:hypothetical protein